MLEYSVIVWGTYSDVSDAELDAEVAKVQKEFLAGGIINYMAICCLAVSSSGSVCSQLSTLSGSRRANHASIVPFAEESVHTSNTSNGKAVLDLASNGVNENTN